MNLIQQNWEKSENMKKTRRHGDYKVEIWRHKDTDSLIKVNKNHGPAAIDDGTHGKWFTNFDKHGSGTYGDREYFENKKQAKIYAKFLARAYPNGFKSDWSSRSDDEERFLKATAADIRDNNYDNDDLRIMTQIIHVVRENEPVSLEEISNEMGMNESMTLNYINEPLTEMKIDEEPENQFRMR